MSISFTDPVPTPGLKGVHLVANDLPTVFIRKTVKNGFAVLVDFDPDEKEYHLVIKFYSDHEQTIKQLIEQEEDFIHIDWLEPIDVKYFE